jgi:hypothetical protein
MRAGNVFLCIAAVLTVTTVSANGETRLETGTSVRNPIIIESQIHDVTVDGDDVIFHLYRQPYDFVAVKWLPVRTGDRGRMYARDLRARDHIHLEGDLDHKVVFANRIVLRAREIHVPGD